MVESPLTEPSIDEIRKVLDKRRKAKWENMIAYYEEHFDPEDEGIPLSSLTKTISLRVPTKRRSSHNYRLTLRSSTDLDNVSSEGEEETENSEEFNEINEDQHEINNEDNKEASYEEMETSDEEQNRNVKLNYNDLNNHDLEHTSIKENDNDVNKNDDNTIQNEEGIKQYKVNGKMMKPKRKKSKKRAKKVKRNNKKTTRNNKTVKQNDVEFEQMDVEMTQNNDRVVQNDTKDEQNCIQPKQKAEVMKHLLYLINAHYHCTKINNEKSRNIYEHLKEYNNFTFTVWSYFLEVDVFENKENIFKSNTEEIITELQEIFPADDIVVFLGFLEKIYNNAMNYFKDKCSEGVKVTDMTQLYIEEILDNSEGC